ncbi:MAG: PAS domain-containing protein [bacterium]|nr:PAS domain-containing protein [bacterium]
MASSGKATGSGGEVKRLRERIRQLENQLVDRPSSAAAASSVADSGGSRDYAQPAPGSLFSQFAAQVEDVFGVLTRDARQMLYISPSIERTAGLKPYEFYRESSRALQLVHKDDWPALFRFFADPDVERDFEFRLVHADGSARWLWIRSWIARDPVQQSECLVFVARDVTERKRAEEQLQARNRSYAALSELTSDYSFGITVPKKGIPVLEWVTPAFERITGYTREEWDPIVSLCADDQEAVFAWFASISKGEASDYIDYRIEARDGTERWLRSGMVIQERRPDGSFTLLGLASDVTASKRLEEVRSRYAARLEAEVAERTRELEGANHVLRGLHERLMRSEHMRTAEHLAASIAHSINNPLAALLGTVQMSLAEASKPDVKLERALLLGNRIRLVVDRTLQLFRKGALDLGLHSPGEILDEVANALEQRAADLGVKLEVGIARDLPQIEVDRALLVEALGSIADNSLDAMPAGGRLTFDVSRVENVDVLRFCVTDTGHGIPEELQEKVLEPFFTTRGGGNGLGLPIARGVVHGHNGRIRLERGPEGGTRACIEVPIRHSQSREEN